MSRFEGEAEALDQAVQYVLGELPAAEARAFERQLAEDVALAAEVARLRNALGLMAYGKPADPPPGLRAKVLAAAEREAMRSRLRAPRRFTWSRYATALAATLALALGLDGYRVRRDLALQQELTQAMLEPNVVRTFRLAAAGLGGAYGTVVLDLDSKRGALVMRRMPSLPAGKTYRLWAEVGDQAVPCGDFASQPDGAALASFVVPVESYTAPIGKLFVTVEPEPPGPSPTGPRIMESA